jgi:hypothetical protein
MIGNGRDASGGALAADLPVKARQMAPVAMVYNWTVCYIGGNVDGKWANTTALKF